MSAVVRFLTTRARWEELSLGYTDSNGHSALREEITKLYETVKAENVLVLVPQEAIQIASRALLRSGDHVVCVRPAYQSLYENAIGIGCYVSFWEASCDQTGRLSFQVDDLKRAIRPDTRAVFVNFPHNPSGALPSLAEWDDIVECCRSCGAYLFADEMYRLLERSPEERLPAAVDCYERGVSLSGMSKAFGMPGIRLGWLATRDAAVFRNLQLLHDYYSICHAAPCEILAIIGLRNREKIVGENRVIIEANIRIAEDFFSRHKEMFQFQAPQGSTVAFPRLLTGEDVEAFCERLVARSGVYLLPASAYDHPNSVAEARFRIGFGRRNFEACMEQLEEALADDA